MTWHADPTALRAYAQGTAPDTVAWSVETHVTGCDTCRAGLSHHLDADDADLLATAREAMALPKQPHTNRIGMRPWPAVRAGVLGPWWAWAGFAAVATGLLTAASLVPIQVAETRLTGLVLLSPRSRSRWPPCCMRSPTATRPPTAPRAVGSSLSSSARRRS